MSSLKSQLEEKEKLNEEKHLESIASLNKQIETLTEAHAKLEAIGNEKESTLNKEINELSGQLEVLSSENSKLKEGEAKLHEEKSSLKKKVYLIVFYWIQSNNFLTD